eukprot:gene11584-11680_t
MALDLETREQLLGTVRRFVSERLRPIEAQVSEDNEIPDAVVNEMKALGLFGQSIPVEYGGLGLTMEEEALAAMEIGKASPAFRSAFGTNVGIGSQGLVMFGTEAQKAKYLAGIASGDIITSFALTEPEAGSDSAAVQTRARRDGDHYILDGAKRYITNAGKASLFTVMARTDPDKKGGAGVSAFLVPRDLPGLSVGKSEKKMGQQGAHIHDVIFEGVRVPVENRLGEEGEGFKVAMQVLDRGRLHIAAVCVGVAERLLALVLESARKRDAGENVTLEASASKLYASEMVGRVADRAVQIFGGAGYVADYGIERLYRDVRIFRIYEGTSQIQQLVIARETMKRGG